MKTKLTAGEVEAVGRVYAKLPTLDSKVNHNKVNCDKPLAGIQFKPKKKSDNFVCGDAVAVKTTPGKRLLVVDSGVDPVRGSWVACRETLAGLDGSRQKRVVVKPDELKAWEK